MLGEQQHSRCEHSLYKLAARQAETNFKRKIKLGSRHLAVAGVEGIVYSPPLYAPSRISQIISVTKTEICQESAISAEANNEFQFIFQYSNNLLHSHYAACLPKQIKTQTRDSKCRDF